jgi:MSHA biogenesis protein MshQ
MKPTKKFHFIQILCVVSSAQAALPPAPALDPPLDTLAIYSGAAVSIGASSNINGNLQAVAAADLGATSAVSGDIVAGAAVTLGANGIIGGDVRARDAATVGADSTIAGDLTVGDAATLSATTIDGNIMVGGDLKAGAAILVGVKSVINGNLTAGATTSADLSADVIVGGHAQAGTALTLGADVEINGNAQAGTGAIVLGEFAVVSGDATAGTSVTVPTSASIGGDITEGSIMNFTNDPIDNQKTQLEKVQADLAAIPAPAANQLTTSLTISTTLEAGIYHTTALSTTAGITLTFDGKGQDGNWLINIDTFLAFGADTKMELLNVTDNSTITWNAGSYTSAGAGSNLIGTFFA